MHPYSIYFLVEFVGISRLDKFANVTQLILYYFTYYDPLFMGSKLQVENQDNLYTGNFR